MAYVQQIGDYEDPRLVEYRSLTDVALRRRIEPAGGFFMAESEMVIRRAVATGYHPRSVLTSRRWLPAILEILGEADVPVLVADSALIQQVTGYHVHRGALAAMHRRPLPSVADIIGSARRIAVFEGIVDHTNVGAAFRSVAGLGFDAVVVDPSCADPLYRRSVRVSMGAVFTLPWTRATYWPEALTLMRSQGFTTVALTPDPSARSIVEVARAAPAKVALLLGTEGEGLTKAALAATDIAVRIPMTGGVDSLNIAAATAVACFAFRGALSDEGADPGEGEFD